MTGNRMRFILIGGIWWKKHVETNQYNLPLPVSTLIDQSQSWMQFLSRSGASNAISKMNRATRNQSLSPSITIIALQVLFTSEPINVFDPYDKLPKPHLQPRRQNEGPWGSEGSQLVARLPNICLTGGGYAAKRCRETHKKKTYRATHSNTIRKYSNYIDKQKSNKTLQSYRCVFLYQLPVGSAVGQLSSDFTYKVKSLASNGTWVGTAECCRSISRVGCVALTSNLAAPRTINDKSESSIYPMTLNQALVQVGSFNTSNVFYSLNLNTILCFT